MCGVPVHVALSREQGAIGVCLTAREGALLSSAMGSSCSDCISHLKWPTGSSHLQGSTPLNGYCSRVGGPKSILQTRSTPHITTTLLTRLFDHTACAHCRAQYVGVY